MILFPVDKIVENSVTDFDLYVELGEQLVLYANAPYHWTGEELNRLKAAGKDRLFHSTADQSKALVYLEIQNVPSIEISGTPQVKVVRITDAAAFLTKTLYDYPLTLAALEKFKDLANKLVATIEEDPHCVAVLGKLARHDDYTYYHSARVAAYALAIAIELSQNHKAQLVEMATGALLHDIGKSRIDLMILNKPGMLSPVEWEQMKKHPAMGEDLVHDTSLNHVSRQIILSHHERFDGSGYPHHLTEKEILEEVKIVSFADTFDALTTNRPYQPSRTAFEALDLIRHKLLKNLHKDSYHALVSLISQVDTKKQVGGT